MTVQVDILHPAHINFFKNLIQVLEENNIKVVITALDRGKVPKIVKKEFPDREVYIIGRHRGTKFSIIFEANLMRFIRMFFFVLRRRPNLGLSVGSFVTGMCMKLLFKRNYQVDDDPERFFNVLMEKLTASKLYFPLNVYPEHRKVVNFNCLKEWAYLSPRYFKARESVLEEYNLKRGNYFFIREVSTGTFNYMSQAKNPVAGISKYFPKDFQVVLSLEDKTTREQYPPEWIILEEPVEDIHSLLFFSKCVISSGDSMAREGAMMGVPAVYCGSREMNANKVLIEEGMLFHLTTADTLDFINRLSYGDIELKDQTAFRFHLMEKWDDINLLLLNQIESDLKQVLVKPSYNTLETFNQRKAQSKR